MVLLVVAPARADDERGVLTVNISGAESDEGKVLVALCRSRAEYESDGEGMRMIRLPARMGPIEHRFENLPAGTYALKVFHDENENDEIDIGWTGPEERYGFSNGARGLIGPPDWDDAHFAFDGKTADHAIELK
jgi:uncharacterized protein (DUF2141 family)